MRVNRFFVILSLMAMSQLGEAQSQSTDYDASLAKSLGADEYGMKSYVFVMLTTGKTKIDDAGERSNLFKGHLENIGRLAAEGKLVLAGPFAENKKGYAGIFILNVSTTEEASKLLSTDPAIHAGILDVELYGWYGSAALPVYLETHKKIEMKKP